MSCYKHEQERAVGTCVHCGKFICEECNTQINNKNYCKECVGEVFNEKERQLGDLKKETSNAPTVFMNAGGGASSSSSSSSSAAAASGTSFSEGCLGIIALVVIIVVIFFLVRACGSGSAVEQVNALALHHML